MTMPLEFMVASGALVFVQKKLQKTLMQKVGDILQDICRREPTKPQIADALIYRKSHWPPALQAFCRF